MTDKFNHDDNNINDSKNTEVFDFREVDIAESKREDDESEYEDVCFVCRRPESKAGRMFKMPNNICVCDDCLSKPTHLLII